MEPDAARDVAAPSPVKKSHGIEFKEVKFSEYCSRKFKFRVLFQGCRLEAKDHMGERWWEAKVLEVDHEGCEVLVHFTGWVNLRTSYNSKVQNSLQGGMEDMTSGSRWTLHDCNLYTDDLGIKYNNTIQ